MHNHFFFNQTNNPDITFKIFDLTSNGINELSENLFINNILVSPTFRYEGINATTSNWTATVGNNLIGQGSGGTVDKETPFISSDESVNGDGTRYWQEAGTSFGDVTTEDIVVEVIFKESGSTNATLAGKYHTAGWLLYTSGISGRKDFRVLNSSGGTNIVVSGLETDVWYHIIYFLDRSGSGVAYVNGVQQTAADISSRSDSITVTRALELNSYNLGTGIGNNNIAYLAMWQKDAWLDTHLQSDIARERFYKACGAYPQIAYGDPLPKTCTRDSKAYIDKYISSSELLPSTDPSSGGWGKLNASVAVNGGSITHPDGATVYDVTETAVSGLHYISETGMSAYTGDVCELSVDVKPASRDWFRLAQTNTTISYAHFDTTNGVIGGVSNEISTSITELSDGWYRCKLKTYSPSAVPNFIIYAAEDNGVVNYLGNGSVALYIANISFKILDRQMFLVGKNWPRICQRLDENGLVFTGFLPEQENVNEIKYSEDFNSWTKLGTSVTTNSTTSPDGRLVADTIVENGLTSQHLVNDTFSQTANVDHVYSVWAKAINRNWIQLYIVSSTDGTSSAYFHLLTGTVGTISGTITPTDYGIEYWGNGWYRCWIRRKPSTTETGTASIYLADVDNSTSFTGLSQDSVYVFGAQIHTKASFPYSYTITSGSPVTRNKDILEFNMDTGNLPNNRQGTVLVEGLLPSLIVNPTTNVFHSLVTISEDNGAADRHLIYNTTNKIRTYIDSTESSAGLIDGTSSIFNNTKFSVRNLWSQDSFILYQNDSFINSSTASFNPPDNLNVLTVGSSINFTSQFQGLMANLTIFGAPTLKKI